MITRWNIDEFYHSDDELYHHGVLGMRWGHRKQEYRTNSQRRMSTGKKVAIGAGIAGGAALAAGGAVLARRNGAHPLRAVKSAAGTIGSKFSRSPKIGTVSKASLGKMTNRHTAGVGSKYLRTPTLNGYFNGQGKALSVGKKPVSSLNRSGSGQVKRMLQRNGNVKVSKVGNEINGKAFNRIGKSYTGVHTPTLNSRTRLSTNLVRNSMTSDGRYALGNQQRGGRIAVTKLNAPGGGWGTSTKVKSGSTTLHVLDDRAFGKNYAAYNWRKLPNKWR